MTMEERFWSKVDRNGPVSAHRPDLGPCWLWTAALDKDGYGRFWDDGRMRPAHTVSWELTSGRPFPEGLEPDHLCRNRACVAAAHLEPVTGVENIRRGDAGQATGARMLAKTHCPQGHPYGGENLYVASNGDRHCRACQCERARRRWKNRRAA